MKSIIFLSSMLIGLSAFGITTKKCPLELKIELNSFSQSGRLAPNMDNSNLPFAYIAIGDSSLRVSDTLKLKSTSNSVCSYRGDVIFSAVIEGSLREGAVKPAVLKTYFNNKYEGLNLGYIAYSPIENITDDKAVVLREGKSELYYRGEQCHFDCISDYIKVGSVSAVLEYDQQASCFGIQKAQESLTEYLGSWSGSDYIFHDDIDEDIYYYNLRTVDGVAEFVKTLYWTGTHYASDSYYNYECAPSASCWGGYNVYCDGDILEWQEGEE